MVHHSSYAGDNGAGSPTTTFVLRGSGETVELVHVAERAGVPAVALVERSDGRRVTVGLDDLTAPPPVPTFGPAVASEAACATS